MSESEPQKLLVANRGEIAIRILKTAKRLHLETIAIYSPSDSLSPHVTLADKAVPLSSSCPESTTYLDIPTILSICKEHAVTLLHPGYGFLSENYGFASQVRDCGVTWVGPQPGIVRMMGLKHEARDIARKAGVPLNPGSNGLVSDEEAVEVANTIGYPVMLKATAGGGGLGMVICNNEEDLKERLVSTRARCKTLFDNDGLFIERYFASARHIEIQVFGNGEGDVVHMGERECSIQRRHQKIIEESPSPFLLRRPELREQLCSAAVRLCKEIKYNSAGTIEFLVDDVTGDFYFLEMNTRIQVEHPVTEALYQDLDIVELMLEQALQERLHGPGIDGGSPKLNQAHYNSRRLERHAIEARIYAENPSENFRPCPGVLQHVALDLGYEWARVDNWVSTGTSISQYFDPLLCKVIVTGDDRAEAMSRMQQFLDEMTVQGPPNNVSYLRAIFDNLSVKEGKATTTFLDLFASTPRAFSIISPGLECTIQDYPGRLTGFGLPRSGPMDSLAARVGNFLVRNPDGTEGLEIIIVPGISFEAKFHTSAIIAVTGKDSLVKINGEDVKMWAPILVPPGGTLSIESNTTTAGFRAYLAVRGGFPDIPLYLGSKSTSMGLGGYQGRSLLPGDQISLRNSSSSADDEPLLSLPLHAIPDYPEDWLVLSLSGPHDDPTYITPSGIISFYSTKWSITSSSNRLGIRLHSPNPIEWARKNGGEGGSHPSNILDNGYALGAVNINGDTPVILTNEGPDMGGYVCLCTVAAADRWKLGQLSPGSTIQFRRISWEDARALDGLCEEWLASIRAMAAGELAPNDITPFPTPAYSEASNGPILHSIKSSTDSAKPTTVFRQAGDSAILIELGPMSLDFAIRARIHALEMECAARNVRGIKTFCPCVRSTMCHFDPSIIAQQEVLNLLIDVEVSLPSSVMDMSFPGRKVTFPIVLDDSWNKEALARYMKSTRDKAVYLPSNIEYLAKNNGLGGGREALKKLVESDWLVFGVGFYLACPFLVPIDPRCRLVSQKMNPSRTYTPRGAIGIAGVVAAIYPIESPGGYQLYGRTLPTWQTWGIGKNFEKERPWLLRKFDQIHFEVIDEEEYLRLEKEFDAGRYMFKIEPQTFSMAEYVKFVESIQDEVAEFKAKQALAVVKQEELEEHLLEEWQRSKTTASEAANEASSFDDQAPTTTSPLLASLSKLLIKPSDSISSSSQVVAILEAMKTEIPVRAGERAVGKVVRGFGSGIREGEVVKPGDVLIVYE